jgi:hypothetical protein
LERLSRAGVTIVAIDVVEAMIALTQSCDEEGTKLGSQRESEVLVKELRDLKSMELSDCKPRSTMEGGIITRSVSLSTNNYSFTCSMKLPNIRHIIHDSNNFRQYENHITLVWKYLTHLVPSQTFFLLCAQAAESTAHHQLRLGGFTFLSKVYETITLFPSLSLQHS